MTPEQSKAMREKFEELKKYSESFKRLNELAKDYVIPEDEFEDYCGKLNELGFYPSSVWYNNLDNPISENITLVGNTKQWGKL
jgi:hypothetical protein